MVPDLEEHGLASRWPVSARDCKTPGRRILNLRRPKRSMICRSRSFVISRLTVSNVIPKWSAMSVGSLPAIGRVNLFSAVRAKTKGVALITEGRNAPSKFWQTCRRSANPNCLTSVPCHGAKRRGWSSQLLLSVQTMLAKNCFSNGNMAAPIAQASTFVSESKSLGKGRGSSRRASS